MLNIIEPYRVPRPRMDEYGNYEIPRTYIKTAVRYVHQILHDKITGPEVAKRTHLGGIYAFMLGSNLYLVTNFNENKVLEIAEELRVKGDENLQQVLDFEPITNRNGKCYKFKNMLQFAYKHTKTYKTNLYME